MIDLDGDPERALPSERCSDIMALPPKPLFVVVASAEASDTCSYRDDAQPAPTSNIAIATSGPRCREELPRDAVMASHRPLAATVA